MFLFLEFINVTKSTKYACAKTIAFTVISTCFTEEKLDILTTVCPFAPRIQGTWLFYDIFHKEEVKINNTVLHFSEFGTFICMEKSVFSDKLYKTVTVFDNGW